MPDGQEHVAEIEINLKTGVQFQNVISLNFHKDEDVVSIRYSPSGKSLRKAFFAANEISSVSSRD